MELLKCKLRHRRNRASIRDNR